MTKSDYSLSLSFLEMMKIVKRLGLGLGLVLVLGLGTGTWDWDLGPGTLDLGIESRIENRESRIENCNYPQSQEMTVKCPGPPPTTTHNF